MSGTRLIDFNSFSAKFWCVQYVCFPFLWTHWYLKKLSVLNHWMTNIGKLVFASLCFLFLWTHWYLKDLSVPDLIGTKSLNDKHWKACLCKLLFSSLPFSKNIHFKKMIFWRFVFISVPKGIFICPNLNLLKQDKKIFSLIKETKNKV